MMKGLLWNLPPGELHLHTVSTGCTTDSYEKSCPERTNPMVQPTRTIIPLPQHLGHY